MKKYTVLLLLCLLLALTACDMPKLLNAKQDASPNPTGFYTTDQTGDPAGTSTPDAKTTVPGLTGNTAGQTDAPVETDTGFQTTVQPTDTGSTPTGQATAVPTKQPTVTPTKQPTVTPTKQPTVTPTSQPTVTPTPKPTATPTSEPGSPLTDQSGTITAYGRSKLSSSEQVQYDKIKNALLNPTINSSKQVVVEELDIPITSLSKIVGYVTADYPEIYYITKSYSYKYNQATNRAFEINFNSYITQTQYNSNKTLINNAVNTVLAKMTTLTTDYEKSKIIHDFIVTDNGTNYVQNEPECYDITGVLIYKEAVCEGYAETYSFLMHKAGVQCLYVVGESQGENHAWNMAKLNGAWYQTDVTWDDPVFSTPKAYFVRYKYLNITDAEMYKDHTVTAGLNYPLPSCTDTSQNYFVKEGLYFTSFNRTAVENVLKEQIILKSQDKNRMISIKFKNQADYQAFLNAGINLYDLKEQIESSLTYKFTVYYTYPTPDSLFVVQYSLDY